MRFKRRKDGKKNRQEVANRETKGTKIKAANGQGSRKCEGREKR